MHPGDGDLSLTWLGHSTVVIDLAGQRLLTDPLLLRHNGPLRRRGPPPHPAQWAGVDAVLLSHLHHDHAELRSLRLVPDAPVLTSERNGRWLRSKGLSARGAEDWTDVGPLQVRLVRAVHHGRPMPHRPNDAHGHLVRSGSTTLWVAGDTSLYAGDGAAAPTGPASSGWTSCSSPSAGGDRGSRPTTWVPPRPPRRAR